MDRKIVHLLHGVVVVNVRAVGFLTVTSSLT